MARGRLGARRSRTVAPLVALLSLGACTSILGIEDLHEGPRPGSGGETTSAGKTSDNAGESNVGGKSTAGSSNTAGGVPAEAGAGAGGDSPLAGATNGNLGGEAGQGGAPNTNSGTVHGHVIDFWGHAVPNIPVQIGEVLGSTDSDGEFVFEDVPETYDVSCVFDHTGFTAQSDAWVYQGLTRRDPTLQMYGGATERSGTVAISFSPKPAPTDTQTIWVSLGGPDGSTIYDDIPATGYSDTSAYWFGPATAQQTAHGLMWQNNGNGLPTSYLGYDSALVALATTGTTKISLDLSMGAVDSGNIQGTVTGNASAGRNNQVALRFNSHATMTLVDDGTGPNSFTYLAPSIPNSSLTVAAAAGSRYEGWAIAHADGLAPGAKPVLKIPPLVTILTPAGGASGVTAATKFSFQSGAGQTGPFVLQFYSQAEDLPYQTIYVVTAKKQLTLPPIIGGGFNLYPNSGYIWSVATHGNFASVDEMASAGGFLDEYSRDELMPDGPRNTTGEFSDSLTRGFTTAP
ncbi:MAG: hypothetical protein ABUL60_31070 [Myxococcales bacterium]